MLADAPKLSSKKAEVKEFENDDDLAAWLMK